MGNRYIVGVLWLFIWTGELGAQRYSFKYYGQDSGLENLDIRTILQDRTGFLWIGTGNGLYRYDGRHFRVFTQADGLPSMEIQTLAETSDGTLWVAGMSGLARRVADRFEKIEISPARGARSMVADSRNRLYLGTDKGLLEVRRMLFRRGRSFTSTRIPTANPGPLMELR